MSASFFIIQFLIFLNIQLKQYNLLSQNAKYVVKSLEKKVGASILFIYHNGETKMFP